MKKIGPILVLLIILFAAANTLVENTGETIEKTNPITIISTQVNQPTPTAKVYPPVSVAMGKLQEQGFLVGGSLQLEKLVRVERTGTFLGLADDQLVYTANGTVFAGYDLLLMTEDAVQVEQATGIVTIDLPDVQIQTISFDEGKSGVFNRETGFLVKPDPTFEQQARQLAVEVFAQQATEAGLLDFAAHQAQGLLKELMLAVGYTDVVFK